MSNVSTRDLLRTQEKCTEAQAAAKIEKGRMSAADAMTSLQWVPLYERRYGHICCLVQSAIKGHIPEHFDVF